MSSLPSVMNARYQMGEPAVVPGYLWVRDMLDDRCLIGRLLARRDRVAVDLDNWTRIHHPVLPRVVRYLVLPRHYLALLPPPGENTFPMASAKASRLKPIELAQIFLSLLQAVRFLDERGLLHPGLDLSSVFIDSHGKTLLYGHESAYPREQVLSEKRVPNLDIRYASPELMALGVRSSASEIYHLAALMVHFLSGKALKPHAPFPGVTRCFRHLGRIWDEVLSAMLDPDPTARPGWAELMRQVHPLGEADPQPVWLGGEDPTTLQMLEDALAMTGKRPGAVALQVFPGPERIRRLLPFTRRAEREGFLVFHTWVRDPEERPYKLANDLIFLLREGVFRHLNRPDLLEDLEPLSELLPVAEMFARWRAYLARVTEALIPEHARGFVVLIEDVQNLGEASLAAVTAFASWLARVPFLLVVTGQPFSHPHFREMESRLLLDWTFAHPTPLDTLRLKDLLWNPGEKDTWKPSQKILVETNHEEILYFYWLEEQRGQPDALKTYLRRTWECLAPKEQLALRVLCCTERALHLFDMEKAFSVEDLEGGLDCLERSRLIRDVGGRCFEIAIPAVMVFCRRGLHSTDYRLICRRLLDYEQGLEAPDLVQIVYLASVLQQEREPAELVAELTRSFYTSFQLDRLWRLERVYHRTRLPRFQIFSLLARLLRGQSVRPELARPFNWLADVAVGHRACEALNLNRALKYYRKAMLSRTAPAAWRGFALVLLAETAVLANKRDTLEQALTRFNNLDLTDLRASTLGDWRSRFHFAARELGVVVPLDEHDPLAVAHAAWCEGHFDTGLAPIKQGLEDHRGHYDLNRRGRLFKLYGNLLFRNNLPGKAIGAYRAAEECFVRSGNRLERDFIYFNLASAENLAGRFHSALARFRPLYLEAETREDVATRCQILYNFSLSTLLLNEIPQFEAFVARHRELACKNELADEEVRGLVLMLATAFSRDPAEVGELLSSLTHALERGRPDRLLLAEARFASRFGSFVLGKDEGAERPYPEITSWRHRLLDFLAGTWDEPFENLVVAVGGGYFGSLNCLVLKGAVLGRLIPEKLMGRPLASVFEDCGRACGADYTPFLREHFGHLHEPGEVPEEEWARAHGILESLVWHEIRPNALLKRLSEVFDQVWPFIRWGACCWENREWKKLVAPGARQMPEEVAEYLKQSEGSDRSGPIQVTLLDRKNDLTRGLLVCPLCLSEAIPGVVWFQSERAAAGEEVAHFQPLFRYYSKLFELAFFQAGVKASRRGALLSNGSKGAHFGLVGKSPRLLEAINRVVRYGASDLNIFICGESGTGKELLARAVHAASMRCEETFQAVNCSHFPDSLVESALFGHVKGAFTGAASDKVGLLEQANGGTLFLDEIGDINEKVQSLLLRVIQEGEFTRIGETKLRTVDIRLVTATNKDLHKLIEQGRFRGDLYFRIVEEEIRLPALRERFEDLPLLATHFVEKYQPGRRVLFERGFYRELRRYEWPGNVRELESYIHKVVVHWPDNDRIGENECLPFLFGVEEPTGEENLSFRPPDLRPAKVLHNYRNIR